MDAAASLKKQMETTQSLFSLRTIFSALQIP